MALCPVSLTDTPGNPVCFLPLPMHFCICFKGALIGLLGRLGVAWERQGPPGLGPED